MTLTEVGNGTLVVESVTEWSARGILNGFMGSGLSVPEDRERWCELYQRDSESLVMLKQVHGADILEVGANNPPQPYPFGVGDGLLLSSVGGRNTLTVGIKTADCFPVLMLARDGAQLMALHCGWRSTVGGILERAVELFKRKGVQADEIEAAIGPGAQSCCYEVGSEVVEAVERSFRSRVSTRVGEGKHLLSIRSLIEEKLKKLLVPTESVVCSEKCTICNQKYYSFRRDPVLGCRQLSFLGVA